MFHRLTGLTTPALIITISLFGLQACGGGDSTTPVTNKDPAGNTDPVNDKTAPTVKSSSVDSSTAVDYTKPITVEFSEKITATDNDVVLHLMPGMVVVPATVAVSNVTLTITPTSSTANPLLPATDYHLILNNTITDKSSNANALAKTEFSFTTAAVGSNPPGGGTGNTGTKTITFIELNDLHANLVPHTEMVRQSNAASGNKILVAKRGGLVRIAAKIDEIRTNYPNNFLMNIGDTYHGGAEAMFSVGNAIVPPVNALGIDIGVPGNWDFAYGPQVTNMRYGLIDKNNQNPTVLRPNYTVLGGNAFYKTPTFDVTATLDYKTAVAVSNDPASSILEKRIPGAMVTAMTNLIAGINNDASAKPMTIPTLPTKLPFLQGTAIKVINGINVGFIGLTSDIVFTMHPMMALNLDFTKGKDAYLKLINDYSIELKNNSADIVVVMSELGIHKDLALADALQGLKTNPTDRPAVDIFFSAHTHELVASNKQIKSASGALVVEAGNDTYLGQMDVGFDSNNVPVSFKWTIHVIDSSINTDLATITANAYVQNVADLVKAARDPYLNVTSPISIPQITLPGAPSIGFNPVTPQTLSASLNSRVGYTDIPLDRKNALESNFNNAYTDMLRNSLGTDIAVTPGFRFDSAVMPSTPDYWQVENNVTLSGEVTISDVYRFMPAAYFLATGTTTAQNLKKILEGGLLKTFSPQAFDQEGGWMFGYSGLKIIVDLKQTVGKRVRKITTSTGKVIYDITLVGSGGVASDAFPSTPGFTLTIAGCGRPFDLPGRVCSMPGFTSVTAVTNPNATGGIGPNASKYPASDFFIDNIGMLLSSSANAISTRKDISDSSNTLMWPDSEFVQPLYGVK